MINAIALTNAQKLELLNKYLIADGKTKVNMWKVARHQPILDAYLAAEQFEATEEELSAQTIRPTNAEDEMPIVEVIAIPVESMADEFKKIEDAPAPPAPVAKPATKKTEKTETVRQNGVRFPKEGGLCWMAWKMFDEMGRDVTVKDAVVEAVKRGLNEGNVRTEICVWRKFHGIVRAKKA